MATKQSDSYGITALRMDDILHLKGVKLGGVIGIGAFGTVLRVEHDGKKYAAKRMDNSLLAEKFTLRSMKDFCRKCSPIFNLQLTDSGGRGTSNGAENIVRYIGIYQEDANTVPLLVMELMQVELRYFLHAHKDTVTYRDKVDICLDITNGLNFLHSSVPEILHRNLHSNNILLDDGLRAKIGDLMNIRLIPPEDMLKDAITDIPGHEEYLAPEVFHDVRLYAAGSDIFSLGILIMEVFTHKPPMPLRIRNVKLTEQQRRKSDLLLLPDDSDLRDVIDKCIRDDCSERPTAKQLYDDLIILKKALQYSMSPSSRAKQGSLSELLIKHNGRVKSQQCSTIPAGTSGALAVKDHNGMIYIGGGWVSDADMLSATTTYKPLTDYWSALPSCPVQYGRLTTVTEEGGTKVIAVGGILEAEWTTTEKLFTWEGSGKWKERYPCMSVPRLNPAVCVYDNKYLIVAAGLGRGHSLDSIEVLDLQKKEWSHSMAKLPYAMVEAVGSIAGDNLIIMGTQSDEDVTNSNECSILSIPINAILGEAPVIITILPPPPMPYATLIPDIDPPMLLGGCSDTSECPGAFVYCIRTNSWKDVGTTSCNRANAAGIVLHNNAVLLFSGATDGECISKDTILRSVEVVYM